MEERIMDRGHLKSVRVEWIQPTKDAQRSFIDVDKLEELKQSISEKGLVQAIGVQRTADNGYEVIWGSRRLMALKELGYEITDAIVFDQLTPLESRILRITENLHQDHVFITDSEDDIYKAWLDYVETYAPKRVEKRGAWNDKGQWAFAKEIGLSQTKMNQIIAHVELRKADDSPEIKNATPSDLDETNIIAKWPEARHALLKSKQSKKGKIINQNLRYAARAVKAAPTEYKTPITEMMVEGKLDPLKAEDFAKALKAVPLDVQDMLMHQKITPKAAKRLAKKIPDQQDRQDVMTEIVDGGITDEDEQIINIESNTPAQKKKKHMLNREGMHCPTCGSGPEMLGWICCGIALDDK